VVGNHLRPEARDARDCLEHAAGNPLTPAASEGLDALAVLVMSGVERHAL
jgi:hypothetical protein